MFKKNAVQRLQLTADAEINYQSTKLELEFKIIKHFSSFQEYSIGG
jgi:hypothetical protein